MEKIFFGTGASSCKDYAGLLATVRAAAACGIRCFDTSSGYGTETTLGQILNRLQAEQNIKREDLFVQTKIETIQMVDGNIQVDVEKALDQMGLDYLDSLLIHWPLPAYVEKTWKQFIKIKEAGLVKRIGICNVRIRHLQMFEKLGIAPEIVQIERNPLRTCIDEIAYLHTHGIAAQAYSPLCKMDPRIRDSVVLNKIAEKYKKSVGQVVLKWHMDTGVIPIFTSTKVSRIQEYTQLYDFSLTPEEIEAITGLNIDYKLYLESRLCPGF